MRFSPSDSLRSLVLAQNCVRWNTPCERKKRKNADFRPHHRTAQGVQFVTLEALSTKCDRRILLITPSLQLSLQHTMFTVTDGNDSYDNFTDCCHVVYQTFGINTYVHLYH